MPKLDLNENFLRPDEYQLLSVNRKDSPYSSNILRLNHQDTERSSVDNHQSSKRLINNNLRNLDHISTASKVPFRQQVTSNKEIFNTPRTHLVNESTVVNNDLNQMNTKLNKGDL